MVQGFKKSSSGQQGKGGLIKKSNHAKKNVVKVKKGWRMLTSLENIRKLIM